MAPPPISGFDQRIAAVRRFSRTYTTAIGVLHDGLHASIFSLTEARVLFEIANRPGLTARALVRDLGLDPGYLSRILRHFTQRGLVLRRVVTTDRRQQEVILTEAGRAAFAPLDAASRREIGAMLAAMSEPAQAELVQAMARIETLLAPAQQLPWMLRSAAPG
ncbi:MAG TPA: MarR family transcriptional regulator, partial [Acetobacteraceae bacterium]|nr:MarR family transcriptional regulator [Acetobacteraceae bacterium]